MTTALENTGVQAPAEPAADPLEGSVEDPGACSPAAAQENAPAVAGDSAGLLAEHKGKLAIGVAATLGLMVYYGWREKRLAKSDPEEYARLQRIKAVMRETDPGWKANGRSNHGAAGPIAVSPDASAAPGLTDATGIPGALDAPTVLTGASASVAAGG